MSQLRATKAGLAVCTAVCLSLFLYLRAPSPQEAALAPTLPPVADCGFYPDELCSALFAGKAAAPQVARFCQRPPGTDLAGPLRAPGNCSQVTRDLHFITRPLSAEEANFPLAYVITARDPAAFVRLLRAIYAPQNLYCVHVGEETPEQCRAAARTLAGCFENILIPARCEAAAPGPAGLQADLDCMQELLRSGRRWAYAINLRDEDFPLRTNREIVRHLRAQWKGRNITPAAALALQPEAPTNQSHAGPTPGGSLYVAPSAGFEAEPPHNLTLYLGSPDYVLTKRFVEFVFTDPRARALLHWSRRVHGPERLFWGTLNHLTDAPGATPDAGWEGNVRATKWKGQEGRGHSGCRGRYVQDRCVYGLGDLPWLIQSPALFASKFEPSADPLVVTCLERRHRLRALLDAEVPLEPYWHFQHQTHFNRDLSR